MTGMYGEVAERKKPFPDRRQLLFVIPAWQVGSSDRIGEESVSRKYRFVACHQRNTAGRVTRRVDHSQPHSSGDKFVAVGVPAIDFRRWRQLDPKEKNTSFLHGLKDRHVIGVKIKGNAG